MHAPSDGQRSEGQSPALSSHGLVIDRANEQDATAPTLDADSRPFIVSSTASPDKSTPPPQQATQAPCRRFQVGTGGPGDTNRQRLAGPAGRYGTVAALVLLIRTFRQPAVKNFSGVIDGAAACGFARRLRLCAPLNSSLHPALLPSRFESPPARRLCACSRRPLPCTRRCPASLRG